jgi:hypothetical protein
MKIKLFETYDGHEPGEVIELRDALAVTLSCHGVGELLPKPPPAIVAAPQPQTKTTVTEKPRNSRR